MTLLSLPFAALSALTFLAFYALPRRGQTLVLLAGSLFFAGTWGWQVLATLVVVILVNFLVALGLPLRPKLLGWGIAFNVFMLAGLKYAGFFVPQFLRLLSRAGIADPGFAPQFMLPVGLSFYVLSAISYLVDVRQRLIPPCRDLPEFALFLSYFPKLLAGPIERARSFLPPLSRRRVVDNQMLARSLARIVQGLVRKLVVADTLRRMIPGEAWTTPGDQSSPMLLLWLLGQVVSIYNDFAGYTDIVRGVSGLFGIELSPNFATPLFSRSFSELWTRWHISLSQWLRDYIYLPMSRALLRRTSDPGRAATVWIPPLLTMFVSGLWHGASLNLLAWGVVNGVYLGAERALALRRPSLPPDRLPHRRQWLQWAIVFALTLGGIVAFLLPLPAALQYLRAIASLDPMGPLDLRVVGLLILSLLIDLWQARTKDEVPCLRSPRLVQAALLALALLAIFLVTRTDTVTPFVYQEF